jgi:pimeloyl-ACP methyl ester carboxylesterase
MPVAVIQRLQDNPASKGHIVLIHGACMGAWVWENNFLPFFHDMGYDVHAISLRGHAGSPNAKSIRWTSIMDYREDLLKFISGLEGPVYLIGHSMGGFTIQHAMDALPKKVRGAVLLCSAPRHGLFGLVLKLIMHYPLGFLISVLRMSWLPIMKHPDKLKRIIFREDFTEAQMAEVLPNMQEESFLAFLQMVFLRLPGIKSLPIPTMIIGAEKDFLVSERDTRKMASFYKVTPHIIKGASHSFMLESGWEEVAEKINLFFQEHGNGH